MTFKKVNSIHGVIVSNKKKEMYGFSLLEFALVFCVIGIIVSVFLHRSASIVDSIPSEKITYQSSAFWRSVESLHAIAVSKNKRYVLLEDGIVIYLNQSYWPIASNIISEANKQSASETGCLSLWLGLMKMNDRSEEKKFYSYEIELINSSKCRFISKRKEEVVGFFDYDVITGRVVIPSR